MLQTMTSGDLLEIKWRNPSFGNDAIAQATDFFHFGFDHVARLEPPGRLIRFSPRGDAARRARGQHVPRIEPHLRPVGDHGADIEDHVTEIGILAHFAVNG